MSGESPDPTIDAVAAVISDHGELHPRAAMIAARALAEAGWLRTAEDRAVLDALYEKEMAFRRYQPVRDSATEVTDELRETADACAVASHAFDAAADAYVARRVAVGGSVPADPETQP